MAVACPILTFKNIGGIAAKVPSLNRLGDGRLIDERAASHVDEKCPRLHFLQAAGIDDVDGFWGERDSKHRKVRLSQAMFKRNHGHALERHALGLCAGVAGKNMAIESSKTPGKRLANGAKPSDENGRTGDSLTVEFGPPS